MFVLPGLARVAKLFFEQVCFFANFETMMQSTCAQSVMFWLSTTRCHSLAYNSRKSISFKHIGSTTILVFYPLTILSQAESGAPCAVKPSGFVSSSRPVRSGSNIPVQNSELRQNIDGLSHCSQLYFPKAPALIC